MNRPHRRSMKNSLLDAAQNQIGASYGRAQQLAAQKARHRRQGMNGACSFSLTR